LGLLGLDSAEHDHTGHSATDALNRTGVPFALGLAETEVGVVDQPENGSSGCSDCRRHDVVTHVSDQSVLHRTARDGRLNSRRNVIDAPVDQGTIGRVSIGQERELIARDVDSEVEGLIEVSLV